MVKKKKKKMTKGKLRGIKHELNAITRYTGIIDYVKKDHIYFPASMFSNPQRLIFKNMYLRKDICILFILLTDSGGGDFLEEIRRFIEDVVIPRWDNIGSRYNKRGYFQEFLYKCMWHTALDSESWGEYVKIHDSISFSSYIQNFARTIKRTDFDIEQKKKTAAEAREELDRIVRVDSILRRVGNTGFRKRKIRRVLCADRDHCKYYAYYRYLRYPQDVGVSVKIGQDDGE